MFLYKTLPTNCRPLPLEVDSNTFKTEWQACWKDPNRDMTRLIEISKPMIHHWEQMLIGKREPDINMISLCRRLHPDNSKAIKKISRWVAWHNDLTSVIEELWLIFIEQIRNLKYFPSQAKPEMAEYVIALDFKNRLKDYIALSPSQKIKYIPQGTKIYHTLITPEYPDYLFIKNLKLNKWEKYLLCWILDRRTARELARYTHIPFDTFKIEEKHIWHLLKENYLEQA